MDFHSILSWSLTFFCLGHVAFELCYSIYLLIYWCSWYIFFFSFFLLSLLLLSHLWFLYLSFLIVLWSLASFSFLFLFIWNITMFFVWSFFSFSIFALLLFETFHCRSYSVVFYDNLALWDLRFLLLIMNQCYQVLYFYL